MTGYAQPGPSPLAVPFSQPHWSPAEDSVDARLLAAQAAARDQEGAQVAGLALSEKLKIKTRKLAEKQAAEDEAQERQIKETPGTSKPIKRQRWLWRDRVPLGGLSLLAGQGDVSKSTLFCQLASWLTQGDMKGEFYGTPMRIGYVVHEDTLEETVIPRMVAHGADMSLVSFLTVDSPLGEDALTFPHDSERLRDFIVRRDVACVFIDPLSASVTGKANDQREMRKVYQIVNNIGRDTRRTVFGLAHCRKGESASMREALIGSIEQSNVARAVLALVEDPQEDGARILSVDKGNLGIKEDQFSLRFRVDSTLVACTDGSGDFTSMPKIAWIEETRDTATDVLSAARDGDQNIDACVVWLDAYMRKEGYEAYSSDVKGDSKFSMSMLNRARRRLGVVSTRESKPQGRTVWSYAAQKPL